MELIIKDLTILLLVSLPINLFFHRIRLPSIMGFLLAGILIGPEGLSVIEDPESIKALAEIGVILLLFVIGLEFSLSHLLKNLKSLIGVGGLQMGMTAGLIFLGCLMAGMPENDSFVFGVIVALSSTAVVLKMITDRAEIDTLHGKLCIGVLLFQDLCVVPLMLVIPLVIDGPDLQTMDFLLALLQAVLAVGAIFFLSRLVVPRTLGVIAATGSREHMTLFVILIILGTCWVSHALGLTLAMGAFIAGMIISESEYTHQIILDILPLKDYFVGIFFISIGMLLNIDLFMASAGWFLAMAGGVILLKGILGSLAALIFRNSWRISFVVGLRLAQVGEFSLILANLALEENILSSAQFNSVLIISILTLLVSPLLIQISSELSIRLFARGPLAPAEETFSVKEPLSGHVIVAGFGLIGRNLSKVLREATIPFLVLELDGERIKWALTEKMNALYGDSTNRDTLLKAGIRQAKMIVFAIPDNRATVQGVKLARQLNPDVYILVRTRYSTQVEELNHAGANQVIPEEFETSIEIFSRVLREFRIPNNIIEQQVELVRLEGYGMFRGLSLNTESLNKFSTYLTASLTEAYQVMNDSWCANKALGELQLKNNTGARLIAVLRNSEIHPNPVNDFVLKAGDTMVLFGSHASLDKAAHYLRSGSGIPG